MEGPSSIADLDKEKGVKVLHWNVRSIVRKIDQIRILLANSTIDVVTISESWLKPHLHSNLVAIEGFQVLRQDRIHGVSAGVPKSKSKTKSRTRSLPSKRGGGLLTYVNVKHSSYCEPLDDLSASNEDIEAQWVLIHRPNCKNIVVCNVYRPPNGKLEKATKYLDECLKVINMSKVNVFILGDLNVDFKNKSSDSYKKLNFLTQSNGLAQLINTTTRNTDKTKSLIDLALTNSKFISGSGTLGHFISDHQPIFVVHKKGRDVRQSVKFEGRSYRKFDRKVLEDRLKKADWGSFYGMSDPNAAWEFVYNLIVVILDEMCPLRSYHVKNYRPDWITNELLEQIKDRDYFYNKAKQYGDEDSWNIAKHLRNTTNANIRRAKRDFILDELEANRDNCKKFWKVIREVIPSDKQAVSQDILLKDNGRKLGRNEVAGFINDFFINVGNVDNSGNESSGESSDDEGELEGDSEDLCPESDEDEVIHDPKCFDRLRGVSVHRVVKEINVSKSSGLTNISSFIIKEVLSLIIPEITFMYNRSLRTSTFPDDWKRALVVPIPKSGDLTLVKNYRPISLLPLPGKILEKLVHAQLSDYLETNSLLTAGQHGFRREHSTLHSVAQLTDYVNVKLDAKLPTLVTYIDFRKAFDCVQHPILLEKLSRLNLDESIVAWANSYLSSRSQRVYANDAYSNYEVIRQGVPQGSVLGPLFYIIYANDLVKTIKNCKVALYADDTVLYTACANFDNSVKYMQQDINSISRWCRVNGIMANTDKTKVMVFGSKCTLKKVPVFEIKYNNVPLQSVTSYKYLGVTLDGQLNYGLHVNKIIASISGKLKQFQRMRSFLNIRAALLVYKSMMLPVLEYGDVLLSSATVKKRKKLQVLQNKGLRCALNKGIETSTDDLHSEAKLLKLKYRREQHLLNFMFPKSLCSNNVNARLENMVTTRSQKKRLLKVRRPKTEKFKRSMTYRGPHMWNSLPVELHHVEDKFVFKNLVSNWIAQKAFNAQAQRLEQH